MEFELDYILIAFIVVIATITWMLWRRDPTPENAKEEKKEGEVGVPNEEKRELEEQDYFDSFAKNKVDEMRDLPFISICEEIEEPYMSEVLVDHLHQYLIYSSKVKYISYGFVVINLKASERKLVLDMFKALETFMKSDKDEKLKFSTNPSNSLGYSMQESMGFETFQYQYTDDEKFTWPSRPENFEELSKKYYKFLHSTATFILRLLARHLKCDPSFFLDDLNNFPLPKHATSASTVRLFRYFNKTTEDIRDLTHIDIDLLTLLPASKDSGLWIAVERTAPEGDLIFFPGSILQLITNGYLKGTIHRVMREHKSERYSMPISYQPRMDAMIKVVDSPIVDEDFEHNITLGFKLPMKVEDFVDSQYRVRAVKRALSDAKKSR